MGEKPENRLERIVSDLMRGRRLKLRAKDADEKEAIIMAARLAAARSGPQRMSPAFRQQLARQIDAMPREGWVSRRTALVAGLGIAAGTVGGLLVGRGSEPGPQPVSATEIVPDGGKWIDVGALTDFPTGAARQVRAGAIGAFVTRTDAGVVGVSSICSDLPCELWWDGSHSALTCPCHNKTFSAQGASMEAYPLPSLDRVKVRITAEGRVEVFGI
jgi:nitrite reductase/ring-hydroxylating ferredoxin subunit